MFTLFSIPKAFDGQTATIQRNAIRSWKRLDDAVQVILLGDEPGVAEAATDFRVDHIREIDVNSFGTPLLNSAFAAAEAHARHQVLLYANADLIFFPEIVTATRAAVAHGKRFMLVGRCYDLDVQQELDDEGLEGLRGRDDGELRGHEWMDYFGFPARTLGQLPAFAVGRPWWDRWMIWRARKLRLDVIDISGSVLVVHQRHGYGHVQQPSGYRWVGPEGDVNRSFLRLGQSLSIHDATHSFTEAGVVRNRQPVRQRIRNELFMHDWGVPIYRVGRWLYQRLSRRSEQEQASSVAH